MTDNNSNQQQATTINNTQQQLNSTQTHIQKISDVSRLSLPLDCTRMAFHMKGVALLAYDMYQAAELQ